MMMTVLAVTMALGFGGALGSLLRIRGISRRAPGAANLSCQVGCASGEWRTATCLKDHRTACVDLLKSRCGTGVVTEPEGGLRVFKVNQTGVES